MKLHQLLASLAISAVLCGSVSANEVKTGGIELINLDNGYKVWTKRVKGGTIPVLTLHGGPGCTHEYFECMEDFLPQEGYQIIYYDQLGSYYSDQPTDISLWTVERFCDEVEQVRKALNLDNFYLYGQSWGGMLAIEYALKHPEHLKGVIISNMTASIDSYLPYLNELRAQLPQESQEIFTKYEKTEEFFHPEYQKVLMDLYNRHLCRLSPWPEPVLRTFKHHNVQPYNVMQGLNEFQVTGNFKDWNRWEDLEKIHVPTLVIAGRYDTMNPADIEKMGTLIPRSRVHICEKGSHLSMYDDQEDYFNELVRFLNDVEDGTINGK